MFFERAVWTDSEQKVDLIKNNDKTIIDSIIVGLNAKLEET